MWIIATLICLGIMMVLIETLLTPGVGFAGILALASLSAACVYAYMYMGVTQGIIVTSIVLILVVGSVILMLRSKTWKKFELGTVIDGKVNAEGDALKVGDQGVTSTRLAPMGQATFQSASCEVRSMDNSIIDAGTEVEICSISERRIFVKPINKQ